MASGGVRVAVTPRQPSVFAGEEFECVIAFTNTHAPRVTELRAAPAAPRRAVSYAGRTTADDAASTARWHRVARHAPPAPAPPGPVRRHRKFASRSEAWHDVRAAHVPSSHPHARQKSVVEHQVEDLSRAFQLQGVGGAPEPEKAPAVPERSPVPDDYLASQSAGVDTALRDSLTSWSREQAPARAVPSPLYPDALPEGHEKLIWAFAQFGGTMELDRTLVRPAEFDQLRQRLARGELAPSRPATPATPGEGTPRLVGGGELAYDTEVEAGDLQFETGASEVDLRAEHTPSVATLAALLARFARPPTPQSGTRSPRHLRTGSTLSDMRMRALLSKTLPTYSTPPTVLGIDLVLAPGETRSCT